MILLFVIYILIGVCVTALLSSMLLLSNEISNENCRDKINFSIGFLIGMDLAAIVLWPIAILIILFEFIHLLFVQFINNKR